MWMLVHAVLFCQQPQLSRGNAAPLLLMLIHYAQQGSPQGTPSQDVGGRHKQKVRTKHPETIASQLEYAARHTT
jgi:hypothetical protein